MSEHCLGWHDEPEGHLNQIPRGSVCGVCGKLPLRIPL